MKCEKCGHEIQIGNFPFCKGSAEDHAPGTFNVIDDSIPGGEVHEHGICHSDGTPRRFYSKSDIARAAKQAGLLNLVEHKGSRGSDKSKFTTRWV